MRVSSLGEVSHNAVPAPAAGVGTFEYYWQLTTLE